MKLHPLLSGPKAVLISHTAVDDPVHCDGYRPAGLAIAGVTMVAVDSVASYLMGYDPRRPVCLQVAAQAGLGSHDLNQLHVYLVQDGEVVPCRDLDAYRIVPPLRVLSGIVGQPDDLFS